MTQRARGKSEIYVNWTLVLVGAIKVTLNARVYEL